MKCLKCLIHYVSRPYRATVCSVVSPMYWTFWTDLFFLNAMRLQKMIQTNPILGQKCNPIQCNLTFSSRCYIGPIRSYIRQRFCHKVFSSSILSWKQSIIGQRTFQTIFLIFRTPLPAWISKTDGWTFGPEIYVF